MGAARIAAAVVMKRLPPHALEDWLFPASAQRRACERFDRRINSLFQFIALFGCMVIMIGVIALIGAGVQ